MPSFSVLSNDPDEPRFTIGAVDPNASLFLTAWADEATAELSAGKRPLEHVELIIAARVMVIRMNEWRERRTTTSPPMPLFNIPAAEPTPPPPAEVVVQQAEPSPKTKALLKGKPSSKLAKAVVEEAATKPLHSVPSTKPARVKLAK